MIPLALAPSLRWSLFAAGLLAPLAGGVVLRVLLAPPAASSGGLSPAFERRPCNPTRLDEACSGSSHCVAGTCVPLRRPVRRPAGEACAEALCEPGLECFRGRCTPPEQVPRAPAECEPPRVRAALAALRSQCAGPDDPDAPLTACTTEAWERLSSQDPQFERRLGELPGVFSLHFPLNKPDPDGQWFTPTVAATYVQQLEGLAPRLQGARQLLIVGRASIDGDGELNRELALRRAAMVEEMLRAAFGEAVPPVRRWALASQHPLALEFFQDSVRISIAWDVDTSAEIRDLLAGDLARLPGKSWRWLHGAINRVVIVVPLACDGHEFFPIPAFAGMSGAEKGL